MWAFWAKKDNEVFAQHGQIGQFSTKKAIHQKIELFFTKNCQNIYVTPPKNSSLGRKGPTMNFPNNWMFQLKDIENQQYAES